MKTLTYHQIEAPNQPFTGIQIKELGVPKGEYWPILMEGKYATVVQLDGIVLCMSAVDKPDYLHPQKQLDELIKGYLGDGKYRIRRVIATGEVSFLRAPCTTSVLVGDVAIATIGTVPHETPCSFMDGSSGDEYVYYVDLLHPYLFDPLVKKTGYSTIVSALTPAKESLGRPCIG